VLLLPLHADTYEGGADINEAFLAAQNCGKGDDAVKWHGAWDALARKCYAEATNRTETNPAGAASALLRAANYWRTSAFFLRGTVAENERVKTAYAMSDQAFSLAAPQLGLRYAKVPMRDGSMELPTYYATAAAPPAGMARSPLMICPQGYDGNNAEVYLFTKAVLRYGFNLLFFEGPGQGAAAPPHPPGKAMRHDYEAVLSSVIDGASATCGFDLNDGVVVYGHSLGGHLLARCALHEARPLAYVFDPFNPSLKAAVEQMLPPPLLKDLANDAPSEQTMAAFEGIGKKMHHKLASRAQVHGVDISRSDFAFYYMKEILKFHTAADEYANAKAPLIMLATDGDAISGSGGHAAVMPHLQQSPVMDDCAIIEMKNSEGAGMHCSGGARSLVWERVMDKLLPLLRSKQLA